MSRERVVAAFDVDGTLTRRDSSLSFLRHVGGPDLFRSAMRRATLAASRRGDRRLAAKEAAFTAVLGGRRLSDVLPQAREFAEHLLTGDHLWPLPLSRLREHQHRGHLVVLVSASPEIYLAPFAELLDADLVCTRLEVVDGLFTGRLVGRNCRGPEKVGRLIAHLGGWQELHAYGNSRSDADMLARADHGTWVRRGRMTRA